MTRIRYTVTDGESTTSFIGPGHVLKMLVAACARGPKSLRDLLAHVERYDSDFVDSVLNGLAVFDEHNLRENTKEIESKIADLKSDELPPFRVFNETTRAASTQPAQSGLIVFNLDARRIVQVQNSYSEILRVDRGRIRENGEPTRSLYHYRLPGEWALVP